MSNKNEAKVSYQQKLRKYNLKEKPILILEVLTGDTKSDKDNIIIFAGDKPSTLAQMFCKKHMIDDQETLKVLENHIKDKISKIK